MPVAAVASSVVTTMTGDGYYLCVHVRLAVCATTQSSGITPCWDDQQRELSLPSP